ncbi:hypothetical protein [Mesorhizobium sp. M0185]|uniref:ParB/RepB/Spo0J family partition protein n=1 Tax=Mesorhizobium sp. M0185 TaxID=2956907 RepID=UPI0033391D5C
MREDMHSVDQYEAFRDLADEGKSVPDIAARFGAAETIVRRCLALGRVSPRLLEAYRNEDMTFEQLSAFTISDDHEAQERVWNELPAWNRYAQNIRSALAGGAFGQATRGSNFLGGLDAYEAAGGSVRRDLFDDKEGGFAVDVVKLDALVAAKLESAAKAVKAEGWRWVEIMRATVDCLVSRVRLCHSELISMRIMPHIADDAETPAIAKLTRLGLGSFFARADVDGGAAGHKAERGDGTPPSRLSAPSIRPFRAG